MPPTHLIRSRHATVYYFRRRVPADLISCFSHTTIIESLRTSDRRTAIIRARACAAYTDTLFAYLRNVAEADRMKLPFLPLTIRTTFTESGKPYQFEIEAEPHEAEAVALIVAAIQNPTPMVRSPSGLPATATQPAPGKTISETYEDYKREKIVSGAWTDGEDTARYDHLPHVRRLIETIGDIPINTVTADQIAAFQLAVLTAPDGGSPRNRAKRLLRAGAVFRWAKQKRQIADDFQELFRHPGKIESNSYHLFDINDLRALFESEEYRTYSFKTPSEYWLPLLGLFTGARLNELCQLRASDVSCQDDIHTISIIDDDADKRLKNNSSRRIIPIHSKLIELGFLDYVKKVNTGRIFPELPEHTARPGDYAKAATQKFTVYRRKCCVGTDVESNTKKKAGRSNKTFHSFRATLISALRRASVAKDIRTRLAGHDFHDTQDSVYTGGDIMNMFSLSALKEAIESVRFEITFYRYRK